MYITAKFYSRFLLYSRVQCFEKTKNLIRGFIIRFFLSKPTHLIYTTKSDDQCTTQHKAHAWSLRTAISLKRKQMKISLLNNDETEIKVMALLCKSCFNQLLSKHCWPGFICPLYNMKKLELCSINKSYQNCYSSYLHPLVFSSLKNVVRYPVS